MAFSGGSNGLDTLFTENTWTIWGKKLVFCNNSLAELRCGEESTNVFVRSVVVL